jgi:hypothetical protein
MKKKYLFVSDPGHGWLAVDRQELKDLGIEKDISSFSYVDENTAYLEEDCDAGIFIEALKNSGHEVAFVEKHQEYTQIRNYTSFKPLGN